MDEKEFLSKLPTLGLFKDLGLTEEERMGMLKAYAYLCGAEDSCQRTFNIMGRTNPSSQIVAMLGYAISSILLIMAEEKWITLENLNNELDKLFPPEDLVTPINPS